MTGEFSAAPARVWALLTGAEGEWSGADVALNTVHLLAARTACHSSCRSTVRPFAENWQAPNLVRCGVDAVGRQNCDASAASGGLSQAWVSLQLTEPWSR